MVLLSAICVQKPRLAFQHAKLAFEQALIASGLTYSIVRPTAYFKSLSGQLDRLRRGKPFLVFGDGTITACKPIADADLAAYLAACLDDPTRQNRILPIGGPGPAITPLDQGEKLFQLLGQPPRFRHVPPTFLDAIIATLAIAAAQLLPAARKKGRARPHRPLLRHGIHAPPQPRNRPIRRRSHPLHRHRNPLRLLRPPRHRPSPPSTAAPTPCSNPGIRAQNPARFQIDHPDEHAPSGIATKLIEPELSVEPADAIVQRVRQHHRNNRHRLTTGERSGGRTTPTTARILVPDDGHPPPIAQAGSLAAAWVDGAAPPWPGILARSAQYSTTRTRRWLQWPGRTPRWCVTPRSAGSAKHAGVAIDWTPPDRNRKPRGHLHLSAAVAASALPSRRYLREFP